MDSQTHTCGSLVQYYQRWKMGLLAICFFAVIGSYSIVKELKDFVFVKVVGLEYLSEIKIYSIFALIPLVFLFSRLVDLLHRYQLLCLYALLYSAGGLICVYFLGHPTIGLPNTDTGHGRLFGWLFYFFLEGYSPFVVSLLWAFFSSVARPSDVKNGYILMSVCSKAGALVTIGGTLWLLSLVGAGGLVFTTAEAAQLLMTIASMLLLVAPVAIIVLMKIVPKTHLHGYEAVYQFEKAREKKGLYSGLWGSVRSLFDGLYVFFRFPYMLGIFGMIFFWEVINVTCNIIRLEIGETATHSPIAFLSYLYEQVLYVNIVGLLVVVVGTRTLISLLGERRSLIAIPVLTGIALAYYLMVQTAAAATLAYVVMRAINYALAFPLRESLYIPTTKAMKFKSKSWIDGFGSKIAKGAGGYYSWLAQHVSATSVFSVHMVFFACIIGVWSFTAHLLGRRFEKAVENNEVIGAEE